MRRIQEKLRHGAEEHDGNDSRHKRLKPSSIMQHDLFISVLRLRLNNRRSRRYPREVPSRLARCRA
jgi:hypothetical protein